MDSISHIALGAIVAKSIAGEKHGNKVMVYGAVAASFPDFDSLFTPFFGAVDSLFIHRGLSHSIFFLIIASFLLTYLSRFIDRDISFKFFKRFLIIALAYLSHIVVDVFNTYGTAIFSPFNNNRVSIDALPIIDIFLLIVLSAIAFTLLFSRAKWHRYLSIAGIAIVAIYLSTSTFLKFRIEQNVKESLNVGQVYSTPLPISICKWMYVAEYDNCYQVGYLSIFNHSKIEASEYLLKNHQILLEIKSNDDIDRIKLFTRGFYNVTPMENGFEIHDLRFSSMVQNFPEAYVLTFSVDTSNGEIKINKSHLKRHII